jgi:hypothetical protein
MLVRTITSTLLEGLPAPASLCTYVAVGIDASSYSVMRSDLDEGILVATG